MINKMAVSERMNAPGIHLAKLDFEIPTCTIYEFLQAGGILLDIMK